MPTFLFLRLDFNKHPSIGPFRAALLQGIDELGSISATARAVGLSFRQVWENLNGLNKDCPHPIMSVKKNGPRGGATLTPFGRKLLTLYRAMEYDANRKVDKHIKALDRLMEEDPKSPRPIPRAAVLQFDKAWPELKLSRRVPAARKNVKKRSFR